MNKAKEYISRMKAWKRVIGAFEGGVADRKAVKTAVAEAKAKKAKADKAKADKAKADKAKADKAKEPKAAPKAGVRVEGAKKADKKKTELVIPDTAEGLEAGRLKIHAAVNAVSSNADLAKLKAFAKALQALQDSDGSYKSNVIKKISEAKGKPKKIKALVELLILAFGPDQAMKITGWEKKK